MRQKVVDGFFIFLHKNKTFIQVFSSTSTYRAFILSLDTKHKYGGVTRRMGATFAVWTVLEGGEGGSIYRP